MAKIKIEIDTESSKVNADFDPNTKTNAHAQVLSRKIGLLSSIDLRPDLQDAFQAGVGLDLPIKDKQLKAGYNDTGINKAKKLLKNCSVIATAGGNVVFAAIRGQSDTQTFVSLVGDQPPTDGTNCRGGVTVHSWKSNALRIGYLRSVKSFSLPQIALYCNQNSNMNIYEEPDWNSQTSSSSPIIHFSGADTSTKKNDASKFSPDFAGISAGIKAIVISADPFFQENMDTLMQAVYSWVSADSSRFVVYPLQDYSLGRYQPPAGQALFYGPDLSIAYRSLGSQARYVFDTGGDAGFISVGDLQSP
jgi:hypothetical protein